MPFLDLFKKDLDHVPASDELRRQEDEARIKLNEALAYESEGKDSKAIDKHKSVVRSYPLTTAAAMSQFKMGELMQREGKSTKAFDAYQKFIDNYKGSSAFPQAISAQFDLAQAGQAGDLKQKALGVIPHKVQESELLEWYAAIIKNAPYSEYAPRSQYAIAELYQADNKLSAARYAYQAFVDKYPDHAKSPEAQYQIGAMGRKALDDGTQDISLLKHGRGAMEDVIVAYPGSARAEEARVAIQQFDAVEAAKFYKIAKFYEKSKKYRSAAIYYNKVVGVAESEHQADAQIRLDAVLAKAPGVAATLEATPPAAPPRSNPAAGPFSTSTPSRPATAAAPAPAPSQPKVAANTSTPPANPAPKTLLKARKGYAGPPAPDLAIASTKPKMRTNPAAVPIVPLEPSPLPPAPDPDSASGGDATLPPDPDDDFLPVPPPPTPEP